MSDEPKIIRFKGRGTSTGVRESLGENFSGVLLDIDDDTIYFKEGVWHRDDGPAVLWRDESQSWYQKGLLHREDGPADIDIDGTVIWSLNGKSLGFEEWCARLNKTPEEILLLRITYGV